MRIQGNANKIRLGLNDYHKLCKVFRFYREVKLMRNEQLDCKLYEFYLKLMLHAKSKRLRKKAMSIITSDQYYY